MSIAGQGYNRQTGAEDAPEHWLREGDLHALLHADPDRDEAYALAGAFGLAAALSVASVFWSASYVLYRLCAG